LTVELNRPSFCLSIF